MAACWRFIADQTADVSAQPLRRPALIAHCRHACVQAPDAYRAGMKRRQPVEGIQYTLRDVPPTLDRALRRRAKQLSKSLNEVALEALTRGAGVSHEVREQHDLDFLFGSWVEDPEVDQALADQRKIDADLRR